MFKWFGIVSFTPHTKVAAFAEHLKDGRIVGSRCTACGHRSFPPRADCERCLSPAFEFVPITPRGRLLTWTRIHAAPTGFEALAPYALGVVDLEDGGRALASFGSSVTPDLIRIGMELDLVPRLHEEIEDIRVDYTLERPGAGSGAAAGTAPPGRS